MLKRTLFLALSTAPLLALSAGTGFSPGLYEYATSTDDGSAPQKSRHCVTPAEAEKGIDVPAVGDGCKAVRNVMGGGRIDILRVCKEGSIAAVGSYTATTFVMDGKVQLKINGQSTTLNTHTTAKRVAAACTAADGD